MNELGQEREGSWTVFDDLERRGGVVSREGGKVGEHGEGWEGRREGEERREESVMSREVEVCQLWGGIRVE